MRNATILVVRLKGVATEAIKNIVLAGIGKLVVVDADDVAEQDLGASFFFRDDDVGKKVRVIPIRLPPARAESLGCRRRCRRGSDVEHMRRVLRRMDLARAQRRSQRRESEGARQNVPRRG